MANTTSAATTGVTSGAAFFERALPIALTYGAFFAIALPLVALRCIPNDVPLLPYLVLLEAVGLGTSHFFITLAVYFDARNLRYFGSSWRSRAIYFGLPLLILFSVALSEALRTRADYPRFAFYFYSGVRFFDFFHVGRQSAGMLQLFKRPLRASLAGWTRPAENLFFVGMGLLQWQTFLLGGLYDAGRTSQWLPAAAMALLFSAIVAQYVPALFARETSARASIALGYFVMQALCAATAVYATWLYLTVLAVHYVEYHVIMAPRCFGRRAGDAGERAAPLRNPFVIYAGLAAIVILFEARQYVATNSIALGFLVHIFDGIFLLHYALDAFLWKFHKPYYRDTLAPLYFQPRAAGPRLAYPGLGIAALALATLAGVAGLASLGSNGELPEQLRASVIAPLEAEEHLRWGVALVEAGDLTGARHHLERAAELTPQDERPKGVLRLIAQQLQRTQDARR